MENTRPKKGDYLMFFYHGLIGGINSIMKIIDVSNNRDLRLINVHFQVGENIHYPVSVGDDVIKPHGTKYCYVPISEDDFKSLITDIDINDIISDISKYRSEPFNVIKEWSVKSILEDHNSIKRVTRDLHKHESFRVYRVWKDGNIIYDPIEGYIK